MLTADLVRARRRGQKLALVELSGPTLEAATAVADEMVGAARERVGRPREEVDEAVAALASELADARLGKGLAKVLDDACKYPELRGDEAAQLREAVWRRAAAAWTAGTFDRESLVREIETETPATSPLDETMWRDQAEAAPLLEVGLSTGAQLVERYGDEGVSAVLTRAVSLSVTVEAQPAHLRSLLRKLAFLQLAVRARALGSGTFSLEIEGPLSMHGSAARYGMRLAMLVPTLRDVPKADVEAEVRWGPRDDRLTFAAALGRGGSTLDAPPPDEVVRLAAAIEALDSGWKAAPCDDLVEVPGELLLAPDLVLRKGRRVVRLELLGHWSRAGLWRRIESAAKLPTPVLFAASSRLRVSEEALDDETVPAALYVYKGVPSARAVVERAERLASHGDPPKLGRRRTSSR